MKYFVEKSHFLGFMSWLSKFSCFCLLRVLIVHAYFGEPSHQKQYAILFKIIIFFFNSFHMIMLILMICLWHKMFFLHSIYILEFGFYTSSSLSSTRFILGAVKSNHVLWPTCSNALNYFYNVGIQAPIFPFIHENIF